MSDAIDRAIHAIEKRREQAQAEAEVWREVQRRLRVRRAELGQIAVGSDK